METPRAFSDVLPNVWQPLRGDTCHLFHLVIWFINSFKTTPMGDMSFTSWKPVNLPFVKIFHLEMWQKYEILKKCVLCHLPYELTIEKQSQAFPTWIPSQRDWTSHIQLMIFIYVNYADFVIFIFQTSLIFLYNHNVFFNIKITYWWHNRFWRNKIGKKSHPQPT